MSLDIFIKVLILGIVEGITEFLPISSTGHLIVATRLLDYPPVALRSTFEIFIQLGAILAVVVYYARELLQMARDLPTSRPTQRFWLLVIVAFVPAGVVGFLFREDIQRVLFNPMTVAIALIVGGIIFIVIERGGLVPAADVTSFERLDLRRAVFIGVAQIFALIPGVSRSGASIIGGMLGGLNRETATKFSFYLAMPTLGIATLYELISAIRDGIVTATDVPVLALGTLVSFVVALLSIAWLLNYVRSNTFQWFGVYRIIAGVVILLVFR
jgi:undecaprenyl-diphosphatase